MRARHGRRPSPWITSLREWLIDAAIGTFFGITLALLAVLITLWVKVASVAW